MSDTKQTTADLVAMDGNKYTPLEWAKELRDRLALGLDDEDISNASIIAIEALAAENERLHGIEERAKQEIGRLGILSRSEEFGRCLRVAKRILHGDANAGGGEYHSCTDPTCKRCEKRPGEYCSDDECNCGRPGNHATLQKPTGGGK